MHNRNRVELIVGGSVLALGLISLASVLFKINFWRFIWPLLIIGLGAAIILRPKYLDQDFKSNFRFLGEYRRKGVWLVENQEHWAFINDLKLNLTEAVIPAGEVPTLRFIGFVSDLKVVVPADLGLDVHLSAFVTELNGIGSKSSFIMSSVDRKNEVYDSAEKKVKIEVLSFVGTIKVRTEQAL